MMRDAKYLLAPYRIHYMALKIKVTVVAIDRDLVTELTDHPDREENVHHQGIVKDQGTVSVKDLIAIAMTENVIGTYDIGI